MSRSELANFLSQSNSGAYQYGCSQKSAHGLMSVCQNTGKPVNQAAAIAGINEGIVSSRQPLPLYISIGCSPYADYDRESALESMGVYQRVLGFLFIMISG
jgi:hypothetical protein